MGFAYTRSRTRGRGAAEREMLQRAGEGDWQGRGVQRGRRARPKGGRERGGLRGGPKLGADAECGRGLGGPCDSRRRRWPGRLPATGPGLGAEEQEGSSNRQRQVGRR
jgi:hypothetical protein